MDSYARLGVLYYLVYNPDHWQRDRHTPFEVYRLISRFFESKFNQLEEREELKHKFCQSIIKVASSIDYNPTLKDIKQFTIAVPHLETIATVMRDNIDNAEPLYMDALAMKKKLLGDEHSSVATSLNNLALLYKSQGKYPEAEPLYVDALAMSKKLLGEQHPDVAISLNNLAGLYRTQGKYPEAEPLYVDALAMKKKLLGDEHSSVATSLNNLALLYKSQGKYP